MSSVGQVLGGIVGGVVGFFVGGPAGAVQGAAFGMGIGAAIDPPPGPVINGPRLSDLSVQTSTYGAHIPRIYGTVGTYGNIFWLENNRLKEVVKKKKSGGKGGGGGATVKTFSYFATFAVGLCETRTTGPIVGVRRIWIGGKLIYDAGSGSLETQEASGAASANFALYLGTEDQLPDPRMQADIGVADCPAYRGLAYIVFYDYPLKDHGNSLMGAQVKVEVVQAGQSEQGNTVLLMHMDSAAMVDECGHAFNTEGSVDIPVRGGAFKGYAEFGNPTNFHPNYVTSSDVADFNLLDQDFTIECKTLIPSSSGNTNVLIAHTYEHPTEGSLNQEQLVFYVSHNGRIGLNLNFNSDPLHESANGAVPDNKLVSCAATRKNGVVRLFVEGTKVAEFTNGVTINTKSGAELRIGSAATYAQGHQGSIDEVRIVKGIALYTGNYVPLKIPFTNSKYISISSTLVALADIIESECLQSGLLGLSDIDTSAIAKQVRGYRVTQTGAIRGAIEPLQVAWPFDVVQSGYKIKFIPRGQSSVLSVSEDDLDAHGVGDPPGAELTISHEMDSQLPRRVGIRYLDVTREYDLNEQAAERLSTDAVNVRDIELPIVLDAGEAAGMSEVLLYLYWLERREVGFTLPPSYRALQPADVITIAGQWGQYELRLTGVHLLSDGRLECSARYSRAAIYTPTAQGANGTSTGQVIGLDGPTAYVLMDVPLMRDEDDMPGFPVAMCGFTSVWPGGVVYQSPDGGQTWNDIQAFTGAVPIGTATNTIGAARTDIIDAASALAVTMYAGELESVSELTLYAGANHFAYGAHGRWEIIGVKNSALQSDGSYILTDFLRGRFGTEWAMTTHQVGDTLVLLTDADMAFVATDSGSIGLAKLYRGITAGASIDSDTDQSFAYAGVNLEPLSPINLNGNRHPTTSDWTLTWVRRGRLSPQWRDLVDMPVGESAESYDVEIYSSSGYTTLLRTISVSTPTCSYTAAQQTADFSGVLQSTLYLKIYQRSATVGRGYALTASITR